MLSIGKFKLIYPVVGNTFRRIGDLVNKKKESMPKTNIVEVTKKEIRISPWRMKFLLCLVSKITIQL